MEIMIKNLDFDKINWGDVSRAIERRQEDVLKKIGKIDQWAKENHGLDCIKKKEYELKLEEKRALEDDTILRFFEAFIPEDTELEDEYEAEDYHYYLERENNEECLLETELNRRSEKERKATLHTFIKAIRETYNKIGNTNKVLNNKLQLLEMDMKKWI